MFVFLIFISLPFGLVMRNKGIYIEYYMSFHAYFKHKTRLWNHSTRKRVVYMQCM